MPTLFFDKSPQTQQDTPQGQLRLSLPRLRVPVQPAAAARVPGAPHRHGTALFRWKSLTPTDGPGAFGAIVRLHDHAAREQQPGEPLLSPVAFAREVLGVRLWEKQEEVLTALTTHRRVAVKAGNGLGKGFCAAVAVLWFLHVHRDSAIALTTAPTFRQVRHILWRQIHRLYRSAAQSLGGEMLDTRWDLGDQRYALGLSADGADQFQSFHSPNMLIVVDEAAGVSDDIYDAIEAVMTSDDPLLLLIGNPTSIAGAFRRAFHEERRIYRTITISAFDSPNVQAGRVIIPGLTTAAWVEERREIWKEDSSAYRARVLGEFSDQDDDTLISLSAIEAAVGIIIDAEYWSIDSETVLPSDRPLTDEVVIAVDVARFGSDSSVILRRRGNCVENIQALRNQDTMQLAGRVAAAIREHHPAHVLIDEVGIGAGVVDRLRELGHPVHGINAGHRALQADQFVNLRAEGFWSLAQRFRSGLITIPNDNELIGQLANLRFSYDSQGRFKIESKDEIRKRGLPSPDKADALMLSFLPPNGKVKIWI